jgi:uncharacterized protein (TIGR03067 family)
MRFHLRTLLMFLVPLGAGVRISAGEGPSLLDGTWVLVSHLENGKELVEGPRMMDRDQIEIKGNEIHAPVTLRRANEVTTFRFTLSVDDTVVPGRCDLVITGFDLNGTRPISTFVCPGIFTSSSNELKLCFAESGKQRPAGFDAKEGSSVLTLQRDPH